MLVVRRGRALLSTVPTRDSRRRGSGHEKKKFSYPCMLNIVVSGMGAAG